MEIMLKRDVCLFCFLFICLQATTALHQHMDRNEPKAISVRLATVGSGIQSIGRVEIQDASNSSNPWGTVCDDQWDNKAASVVCRQLGYKWGEKVNGFSSNMWRSNNGEPSVDMDQVPIFLDEVQCVGNETTLIDCLHYGWGNHDCLHSEDAGAICHNNTVRLKALSDDTSLGNVQVMHRYKWADVCDTNWNNASARLACQELGFIDGIAMCCSAFGTSTYANLDYSIAFNCSENDTSLETCKNETFFDQCDLRKRASVVCYNTTLDKIDTNFSIRLTGDEDFWGRVEIHRHGVWGQICVTDWDDAAANVTCRQLNQGFIGGHALGQSYNSKLPILISSVSCNGNESTIEECKRTRWGDLVDYACKTAYVLCYKTSGVSFDIVDSSFPRQGRLQLTFEGVPGSLGIEEWSDNDAHIACRQMGYASGVTAEPKGGVEPYYLNRLICYREDIKSILQCGNTGWSVNATGLTKSAYVKCYSHVRLHNGGTSSGIVEIHDGQKWIGLCDFGFTKDLAKLVCRETSHTDNGEILQHGAYGAYYRHLGRPNLNCSANETSVSECPYDEQVSCAGYVFNYASVSCYNGSDQNDKQYKLFGVPDTSFGPVIVSYKHQLGEICPAGWSDEEANVFCRALSPQYVGGVSINYHSTPDVPMLLSEVTCMGNETKMAECKTDETLPCYMALRAGSICYKESGPKVRLVDGEEGFGRVVIEIDGQSGLVIDKNWSNDEARVICKQINDEYTQGEIYSNFIKPTSGEVYLSDISCNGGESSILHCEHSGWRTVQEANYNHTVGVHCYGNVRVYGGTVSSQFIIGRVQVISIHADTNAVSDTWVNICADGFDQVDADVVCRQMGFDVAESLVPGFMHLNTDSIYYTNMTCKDGGTNVIKDCKFNQGECKQMSHNIANVLCRKKDVRHNTRFHIQHGYHGLVYAERYGINGTICIDGWDDYDAAVICRENGYKGGVILGGPEKYFRNEPVWFTNVSCTNETSLENCLMSSNVPISCTMSLKAAGVLCYNGSGVRVDLENDKNASNYGKIRVTYDDKQAYVCRNLGAGLPDTVCRQLGFPNGEFQMYSDIGSASESPIWLSDLNCIDEGPYDSILACSHKGWGERNPLCYSFAEVKCKKNVMIKESEKYGAVGLWNENRYSLVCADDFDDDDAMVVCRGIGYPYGKSLCCNAFGTLVEAIEIADLRCTGNEMDIRDCQTIYGVKTCASDSYASVVCSIQEPPVGFSVSIRTSNRPRNSTGVGPVAINYFNQDGDMCDINFDDRDAAVICRQLGYLGGFAYRLYNITPLYWMKGPNCIGEEMQLEQCADLQLGNVSGCQYLTSAAVLCHNTEERSGFNLRLSNSNHPSEGYVEIKVNGTWGSICTADMYVSQYVATIICKQLNFKDGYESVFPTFPQLTGNVWLNRVYCNGDETSLKDCMLAGFETSLSEKCLSHKHDLAVKCYSDVRLSGVPVPNYGMVQVLSESNSWTSVCDVGFSDVEAKMVCKSLGYKDGKAQCCSALGSKLLRYSPLGVSSVSCNGTDTSFSECQKQTVNVTCESGMYASAICTDESPPTEELQVKLKDGRYYGDVEVVRYGMFGSLCDTGWDDVDATVLCRSMGYTIGYATNGTNTGVDPMILTSVDCTGNETNIGECKYPPLNDGHDCSNRSTRAAALCSMDEEKIRYRVADMRNERGRAEIYFNGRWGTICDTYWENTDADIFCKQAGYLFGESTAFMPAGHDNMPIWMTRVECTGNETDFLQCRASWDRNLTSRCSHFEDAGVRCYSTARLFRGDYMTKRTNGIVEIYVQPTEPLGSSWYTVCADTFTNNEADVVCRSFGHERGISVCCGPYGYSTTPMASFRPKCTGIEKKISDCEKIYNSTKCSRQNYASVVCFNGTRPTDEYEVDLEGSLQYTGQVVVNYLGVSGGICWTGWTDADARVVCRELGFKNGSAYYHYKSSFIYLDYNGPYWTSDVRCSGNETKLSECPHAGFGNVTVCHDRGHYAGVICFDAADMAFRISGGNDRYGRVEFQYNNQWHSICSQNWGYQEADVMCRQLGYVTGDPYNGDYIDITLGNTYTIDFRCNGSEENIVNCPHEGLSEADHCKDRKDDEGVFCYTSVKLSGKPGTNNGNGTVLYYNNKEWQLVCDDDFDDVTANMVCRELGYVIGYAICCSAYGKVHEDMMTNQTIHCKGDEISIDQCIRNKTCNSTHYASAVCFNTYDAAKDDSYKFEIAKSEKGQVHVTHYGVKGRICSRDWDDRDATVFCRTQGFDHGLSYQHSESNVKQDVRGPYWLSGFNCTGAENSLLECPFMDRTALGNCTSNDIASVLCYNESGIEYRLADGGDHYGRVEISVGGRWGTICDSFWDEREAGIFCRQMNFTDGEPVGRAHFGEGTGPIWLSHLECKGTEKKLHECPHRGFANEFSYDWWFPLPCETHADDAGVFCYKSVRLNNGPNSNSGGLEMFHSESWHAVCDTGFGQNEAKVACRSLKTDYVDGRAIPGSAYGNNSKPILFSYVNCSGDEKDIMNCRMEINTTCPSGHYVSVDCSDKPFVDDGFQMRLSTDSLAGNFHGILEVKVDGIWGRICLHNFDDTDASVACRQLGFDGGVAYLHIMKNDRPVLMREVTCVGNETSLEECASEKFTPDLKHCGYGSNDAGVVCYNVTNGVGFEYRLVEGTDPSVGRVEIGYSGKWGAVCSWSWQTADARVLCRSMGFVDGIVKYANAGPPLPLIRPWVSGFFCLGSEPSPLTCLNTGFNSSFLADLCIGRKEYGAHSQCFNSTVALRLHKQGYLTGVCQLDLKSRQHVLFAMQIDCTKTHLQPTKIRLVDGPNNYTGRVEVFVSGANEWGTICDDHWDDVDAHVTCRQLGYYGGTARRKAEYGSGTGPIWFDNMKCNGSEETIFHCEHRGIGTHNCNHKEDVGVVCQENPVENMSSSKSPLSTTTTEKSPTKKVVVTEPVIRIKPTTSQKAKPTRPTTTTAAATTVASSTTVATTTKSTISKEKSSIGTKPPTSALTTPKQKVITTTRKQTTLLQTTSSTTKQTTQEKVTESQVTQQQTTNSTTKQTTQEKVTERQVTQQQTTSSTTKQTTQENVTVSQVTQQQTTSSTTKQTTQEKVTESQLTQQQTTHEATTRRTKQPPTPTRHEERTTLLQTTQAMTSSTNKTKAAQRNTVSRASVAAAVIIPICLIILLAVIIVIVFIVRKRKRNGYGRQFFDDSIVSQDHEGNISATNQIYDLDLATNSNSYAESVNSEKVNINKNGKANYFKGSKDKSAPDSNAFANPLYEANKNLDSSDMENQDLKLSRQEDIELKNSFDFS